MTLKPEDFQITPLAEAQQQYPYALEASSTHQLDRKTSFWVIKREAWFDLLRSMDIHMTIQTGPTRRKELLGLPVRVTIDDDPDVPMVQLVMEPKLSPVAPKPRKPVKRSGQ